MSVKSQPRARPPHCRRARDLIMFSCATRFRGSVATLNVVMMLTRRQSVVSLPPTHLSRRLSSSFLIASPLHGKWSKSCKFFPGPTPHCPASCEKCLHHDLVIEAPASLAVGVSPLNNKLKEPFWGGAHALRRECSFAICSCSFLSVAAMSEVSEVEASEPLMAAIVSESFAICAVCSSRTPASFEWEVSVFPAAPGGAGTMGDAGMAGGGFGSCDSLVAEIVGAAGTAGAPRTAESAGTTAGGTPPFSDRSS
mmetsp:Transcript_12156/g.29493  ORF Transcript_12156/g.29493 Transcript_12156/m.29493 type:complete len:253 (+) Transcript_12156:804-1562(+)